MSEYAAFARFYDAVQGDRADAADYARSLLEHHHPEARSVLEFACGTGSILARLRVQYEVVGVDLSEEMLAVAKRKLPGVELVRADMTRVRLGRRFDAVLCLYDSINHLLRWRQWEAVFDTARAHLQPDGVFVFDVNTERRLAALAALPPTVEWFDRNVLLLDVADAGRGVVDWRLRVFERTGEARYRLHESTIPETSFPLDRIRESLARRFRRVRVLDPLRSRPTARSGRLWLACKGLCRGEARSVCEVAILEFEPMRVIAGSRKGHTIAAPRGLDTRPTSDRVRENVFNLVGPLQGAAVLDLYAGSGAMGIEALSRGAGRAVFAERDPDAVRTIERNLDRLRLTGARVVLGDALTTLAQEAAAGRKYDLVLVDPPYDVYLDLQPRLARRLPEVLATDGLLVVETDGRVQPELPLPLRTSRKYGSVRITVFEAAGVSAVSGGGGAGLRPAGADAGEGRA